MAYTTVANMFEPNEVDELEISLKISLNCQIDLEAESFHPGDIIRGNLRVSHDTPFKSVGFLIVVDGTVRTIMLDEIRPSRRFKDFVTNLHVFTYVVGTGKQSVKFYSGAHVYPFGLKVPLTNIPGTFSGQCGTILYTVKAILDFGFSTEQGIYVYNTMAQKPIFISSYFNIASLKSLNDFGRQSRQMRKTHMEGDSISSTVKVLKTPTGESIRLSNKQSKHGKLKFILNLCKSTYIPGENIQFRIKVENPMLETIERLVVSLILKTRFTVWSSKTVTEVLISSEKSGLELGAISVWNGDLIVPKIKMPSSVAGKNQLIIFQYFVRVETWINKKVALAGECLIGIGTHRGSKEETELEKRKQKKLILDLEKCKYPLGFSEMYRPEDWDLMHNTGRIGYCENKTIQEIHEELTGHGRSHCASICSFIASTPTREISDWGPQQLFLSKDLGLPCPADTT